MNTVNITFTKDQLNVLNEALVSLPYKHAAPLIAHINAEIQRNHNEQADLHDARSGQTTPLDSFAGD